MIQSFVRSQRFMFHYLLRKMVAVKPLFFFLSFYYLFIFGPPLVQICFFFIWRNRPPARILFNLSLSIFFFCFFFFLGPRLWHMEVPRPGVKSELQLPAYVIATTMSGPSHVCDLHCSSQQCQILDPLSDARDQTCILMDPSWV